MATSPEFKCVICERKSFECSEDCVTAIMHTDKPSFSVDSFKPLFDTFGFEFVKSIFIAAVNDLVTQYGFPSEEMLVKVKTALEWDLKAWIEDPRSGPYGKYVACLASLKLSDSVEDKTELIPLTNPKTMDLLEERFSKAVIGGFCKAKTGAEVLDISKALSWEIDAWDKCPTGGPLSVYGAICYNCVICESMGGGCTKDCLTVIMNINKPSFSIDSFRPLIDKFGSDFLRTIFTSAVNYLVAEHGSASEDKLVRVKKSLEWDLQAWIEYPMSGPYGKYMDRLVTLRISDDEDEPESPQSFLILDTDDDETEFLDPQTMARLLQYFSRSVIVSFVKDKTDAGMREVAEALLWQIDAWEGRPDEGPWSYYTDGHESERD